MNITIETTVSASIYRVWKCFTRPEHITQWNFASPEWECPKATNDPVEGGVFNWRMEAKNGSMGFDYMGTYGPIVEHEIIQMVLGDGPKVLVRFTIQGETVRISEEFEIEDENSAELQRKGWQAILDNFKVHVEQKLHLDYQSRLSTPIYSIRLWLYFALPIVPDESHFNGHRASCFELLRNDELVAIPTETVYGLAGNIFSETAIRKIFELKAAPVVQPVDCAHSLHCAARQFRG